MLTSALPSSMSSRVRGTLQGSRILLSNNHKHKDCPLGHDVFTQKYDQLDFNTCESAQTHQNTQTQTLTQTHTQTHTCTNTRLEVGLDWLEQLWEWGGVHRQAQVQVISWSQLSPQNCHGLDKTLQIALKNILVQKYWLWFSFQEVVRPFCIKLPLKL